MHGAVHQVCAKRGDHPQAAVGTLKLCQSARFITAGMEPHPGDGAGLRNCEAIRCVACASGKARSRPQPLSTMCNRIVVTRTSSTTVQFKACANPTTAPPSNRWNSRAFLARLAATAGQLTQITRSIGKDHGNEPECGTTRGMHGTSVPPPAPIAQLARAAPVSISSMFSKGAGEDSKNRRNKICNAAAWVYYAKFAKNVIFFQGAAD